MRWVVRGLNVERTPAIAPATGPGRRDQPAGQPAASALLVQADGGKPRTVRLAGSTVVGRAIECDLRLDDTYVSQQHARIFGKNGSWYVEDLGSTNGTFVNEQRLAAPAMLAAGDRIRVGTTVMELRR